MPTFRMSAKRHGTCAACKQPTPKDSPIEYDWQNKVAYHPECRPGVGNPRESTDEPGYSQAESAVELADRLGFH